MDNNDIKTTEEEDFDSKTDEENSEIEENENENVNESEDIVFDIPSIPKLTHVRSRNFRIDIFLFVISI